MKKLIMSIIKRPLFNEPLKVLLATNAFILLASAMLGPIYALFVEDIGGDLLDASLTGAVFAIAAGLTTLLMGSISDRVKENELIVVAGYIIVGLGFFLYIFTDSIKFLFIVQIIIGLGEAIWSPAFDAVYSKHMSRSMAGRQWGAWESMNYFVGAAGAAVGGWVASRFGFNTLFVSMALLCFGSAWYIYRLPRKLL